MAVFFRVLGLLLQAIGIGVETGYKALSGFMDVVLKAVQQSKIFITILFITAVIAFFSASEHIISWMLDDLLDLDSFASGNGAIDVSFLVKFIDFQPLISFASWVMSFWITEKAMLGSVLGLRIINILTRNYSMAIKV